MDLNKQSGSGNLALALDQAALEGDDFLSGELTTDQIANLTSEFSTIILIFFTRLLSHIHLRCNI